jgi:hypothetical protein
LRQLGVVDFRQGNLERALDYGKEGLRLAYATPDYNNLAFCLGLLACTLAKQGQAELTARLSGAAKSLYKKQGRKPKEDSSLETILPGWQDRPDQERILQAFEEGQELPLDQVVALVL